MNDLDAVPNPVEDLKHAHLLLAQMSPEELLKATYALEEIIEESPWFIEKMRKLNEKAAQGPWFTMTEVLDDLGLDQKDFSALVPDPLHKDQAA